ncbi:MAG TPA: ATP-binding cassette domain-containing protein, partial [Verrucomicrobiae bacterium]|nr:ATP-binding cassette domain-containing protein [Verrucomicrobiae bacterium]
SSSSSILPCNRVIMDTPPANQQPPVIEMIGVTVGAMQDLDKHVLEDVNWRVAAEDYWVVAGMQGTGKSDLLFLADGLMPPQSGRYLLFGQEMPMYEDALLPERLRTGLVFASGQLFHHLTIADNIALPLLYHRHLPREEAARRVQEMLDLTELSPWANSMPGALGRNWQKRAGLARALILQPEVLLLDTPLSGLDLRQVNWWLNFLGQLSAGHGFMNGRRMTLVVTAEDLRPWKNLACRFAILQKKRFIVLGHGPQLAEHAEPLVKELLAEDLPGK